MRHQRSHYASVPVMRSTVQEVKQISKMMVKALRTSPKGSDPASDTHDLHCLTAGKTANSSSGKDGGKDRKPCAVGLALAALKVVNRTGAAQGNEGKSCNWSSSCNYKLIAGGLAHGIPYLPGRRWGDANNRIR